MKAFIKIYLLFWLLSLLLTILFSIVNNFSYQLLIDLYIGAFLILATLLIPSIERKRAKRFIEWIINNKQLILSEGAYYNEAFILPDTEVTQFEISLSCIVYYTKIKTRYYIRWHDYTNIKSFKYSLMSLMIGWWGLPFAPVNTIYSIIINIKGGHKTTVGDIINDLNSTYIA